MQIPRGREAEHELLVSEEQGDLSLGRPFPRTGPWGDQMDTAPLKAGMECQEDAGS